MARPGERLRVSRKFKTRTRRARDEVLTIHSVQRSLTAAIVLLCTLNVKEMSPYTFTVLSVDCDVNKYFTFFSLPHVIKTIKHIGIDLRRGIVLCLCFIYLDVRFLPILQVSCSVSGSYVL